MKNILVIAGFCFVNFIWANKDISRKVGAFTSVKVFDLIRLKMIKSNENRIVITGKNKDAVIVINKNGKLKIRMNLKESFDGKGTDITLYYTHIDLIDVNEASRVEVEGIINQSEIEFKAQEGSEITAHIETKTATIRAVTGGKVKLKGSSKKQHINLYAGGFYNGKDFISDHSFIRVHAGGEAHINTVKQVKIRIKAGGDVYMYGNPNKIDKKTTFGGRIIKK